MDSLSYWKVFFNIFRKDVTITKSDTKMTSIINIENNTSENIKITSKSPTKASDGHSKTITEFDGVFETPRFDLFDLVESNLDKDSSDTSKDITEGLNEFDEILQEVNGDIFKDEQVSLDEIDNVLNNISEVENPKQDYLEIETPIFERQNLNQSINLCSENSNASNYLDITKQSIHLNETNVPNNFDENKASEGDHTININANLNEADIISISSENSQESNEIFIFAENTITLQTKASDNSNASSLVTENKETNNDNKEPKTTESINLCSENSNASNYLDITKQLIHLNETNVPNNFDENTASKGDHTININANLDEADIISISSENSQKSNEVFISAENTITLQAKVSNNSNEPLLATQNKETNNILLYKEPKNTDFNTPTNLIDETKEINRAISIDVSDDDCGYRSSDFEFITEDEAKLHGIIINFNPKKRKIQKTDKCRKVNTTKIAIDNYAGQIIEVNNRSVDSGPILRTERPGAEDLSPRPSSSQKNKPVTDIFFSGPNEDPQVHPEFNIINPVSAPAKRSSSNLRHFRRKCSNNFGHSSKIDQNPEPVDNFEQNNNKDGKTVQNRNSFGPTIQINCTEACNVLQINYHKNNTRNNCLGFNNIQSKCPTSTEDRWRDVQYRNRLIRQHFESNRENHRIFEGDEYYNLFSPNVGSLPNQIRFLENKSTMSGSMLVDYQGIGFNMQMLRNMDENETDEVKDEADKCARKIFKMYPGENRRKRRRF